jgi:hypothetical protein
MVMRKYVAAIVVVTLVIVVMIAVASTVNLRVYVGGFLTKEGLATVVLFVALFFFFSSVVVFVFILGNERRRRGRSGVSHFLAKRSYGGSLGAKYCGDTILNAVSTGKYCDLRAIAITRSVIDHLVDHSFNVKLHNYMNFRVRKDDIKITPEDLERLLVIVESWRDQRAAVAQTLDSFVRDYAGIDKAREYKRAIYFLDRREKYFVGICDEFIIDVKSATISVLSGRLAR